jgi:hypothetical protein
MLRDAPLRPPGCILDIYDNALRTRGQYKDPAAEAVRLMNDPTKGLTVRPRGVHVPFAVPTANRSRTSRGFLFGRGGRFTALFGGFSARADRLGGTLPVHGGPGYVGGTILPRPILVYSIMDNSCRAEHDGAGWRYGPGAAGTPGAATANPLAANANFT